jgi:hypothetical protein
MNKIAISLKKIARMIARMTDVQKLRQKSQSNNLEMSFGALAIMLSLIPNFPISNIINAAAKAIYIKAESSVIK